MRNNGEYVQQIFRRNLSHPIFLGTCFAMGNSQTLLTAAHCIDKIAPSELTIAGPGSPHLRDIISVNIHPTADLAILIVDVPKDAPNSCFFGPSLDFAVGLDFHVIGAPNIPGPSDLNFPPYRFYKGYSLRFFDHTSHMRHAETGARFTYQATELNIACPAGLSGSPIYPAPPNVSIPWGLITENFTASRVMDSYEEERGPGNLVRVETHRIIEYGIGLRLFKHAEWINNNSKLSD